MNKIKYIIPFIIPTVALGSFSTSINERSTPYEFKSVALKREFDETTDAKVKAINVKPKEMAKIIEPQKPIEEPKYTEARLTWYCPCTECCDEYGGKGITASGTYATEGRTIAVPKDIPFFTPIYIEYLGGTYVAEDRGSAIKYTEDGKMKIDIFINSHEQALINGVVDTLVIIGE